MKKFFILLLFLGLVVSCQKTEKPSIVVIADIANLPENELVRLIYREPEKAVVLDSVFAEGSRFELKTSFNKRGFYVIAFQSIEYPVFLYLQSGDSVYLSGDFKNLRLTYRVKGSKTSELIQVLENRMGLTDSLFAVFLRDSLTGKIDSLFRQQRNFNRNFIWQHTPSMAVIIAFSQKFPDGTPVLSPFSDMRLYEFADSALLDTFALDPNVKQFHQFFLNKKVKFLRDYKPLQQIRLNKQAIDFEIETINGKFKLSENKGKYIVLNFWASWCAECRNTDKYLSEVVQEFPQVVAVQISLDVSRQVWLDTLKKYDWKWIKACDCKGWGSDIVEEYDIRKIPSNVIISPEGEILAMNVENKDLLKTLKNFLNK